MPPRKRKEIAATGGHAAASASNKNPRIDGKRPMSGVSAEAMQNFNTKQLECSICMGILRDPLVTECMHRFCKKCIGQHLRQ